ncbi:phosphohistidine phosphatase SixA [Larkinella arboricola]|uniref:Phosphohistidine phosphatase SixA n=1 Tax=Larkinella arboricola TaxID=643671 RepID=A0A327XCH8_LARAB|nr:phosphoglycerate mutase family protein [Larkinella arboricola]RAK01986.1 phosphohistidine phosphatase SixA [Larkinella arboricola]
MKNVLVVLGLLAGLTGCSTSTVFIVRHAEKVSEADTSSLTTAGFERVQALADRLEDERISLILTTPYRRTQQTAAPLARQLNVPIESYPGQPIGAVVERIQRAKGKNTLVVGHSNTILDIVKGLGAVPTQSQIEPGDHDNLFVVTRQKGLFGKSIRLREETYGQPTAP